MCLILISIISHMKTLNFLSFTFLMLTLFSANTIYGQQTTGNIYGQVIAMSVAEGAATTMNSGQAEWIRIQEISSAAFRNGQELAILLERGENVLQSIPNGPIRIQLPPTEAAKLKTEVWRGEVRIKKLVIRIPSSTPQPHLIWLYNVLIKSPEPDGSLEADAEPQDAFMYFVMGSGTGAP